MSYPDALDYINFLFERLQDFETETESSQTPAPGRPKALGGILNGNRTQF